MPSLGKLSLSQIWHKTSSGVFPRFAHCVWAAVRIQSGNLMSKWQSGVQVAIWSSSGNLVLKRQSGAQVAIRCSSANLVNEFPVNRAGFERLRSKSHPKIWGFGCLGQRTSCNTWMLSACRQENAVTREVFKTCGAPDKQATVWSGFRHPPLPRCPPSPTPGSGGCA